MPHAHSARIHYLDCALARCDPADPCPGPLVRVYDALVELVSRDELPPASELQAMRRAGAVRVTAPLSSGVVRASVAELADLLEGRAAAQGSMAEAA